MTPKKMSRINVESVFSTPLPDFWNFRQFLFALCEQLQCGLSMHIVYKVHTKLRDYRLITPLKPLNPFYCMCCYKVHTDLFICWLILPNGSQKMSQINVESVLFTPLLVRVRLQ